MRIWGVVKAVLAGFGIYLLLTVMLRLGLHTFIFIFALFPGSSGLQIEEFLGRHVVWVFPILSFGLFAAAAGYIASACSKKRKLLAGLLVGTLLAVASLLLNWALRRLGYLPVQAHFIMYVLVSRISIRRIVQMGTHAELVKEAGEYQSLYRFQFEPGSS